MSKKSTLVVILGAGFSSVLGVDDTKTVSDKVRAFFGGSDERAKAIAEAMVAGQAFPDDAAGIDLIRGSNRAAYLEANFESDVNSLESLISVAGLGLIEPRKRSGVARLLRLAEQRVGLERPENLMAMLDGCIYQIITAIETSFREHASEAVTSARAYFEKLAEHFSLAIYNLNYDPIVDDAIENLNDGFVAATKDETFDARTFLDGGGTRLAHVHGSTRFGIVRQGEPAIVKFRGDRSAEYAWYREAQTQAGDFALIGCIVTGLRKTEKTRFEPYGTYSSALDQDLYKCSRILLIGYGASDIYIDQQLIRAQAYHRDALKVASITCALPSKDKERADWLLSAYLAGYKEGKLHELTHELPPDGLVRWGNIAINAGGFKPEDSTQIAELLEYLV